MMTNKEKVQLAWEQSNALKHKQMFERMVGELQAERKAHDATEQRLEQTVALLNRESRAREEAERCANSWIAEVQRLKGLMK